MRTFLSRLAVFSLMAAPVWAQTAPTAPAASSSTTPAATSTDSATPAAPAQPSATAAATPAAPAPTAPASTATASSSAPAGSAAPAAPAPQSKFNLVLITPGGNPPATITESTPSSVAWNMYPSTTGLMDPGAAYSSRLSEAILIRIATPNVILAAPVIPAPVYTPVVPASPYRFSSGW